MTDTFDVVAVQMDVAWEDPRTNLARAEELVASASPRAGSLVILPELFATGYTMSPEPFAEREGGVTEQFLAQLARRHRSTVIGGVVGAGGVRPRNEAVVLGPDGSVLVRYRKTHLFTSAGESDAYLPGDEIVLFQWQGLAVAPLICYDLRFPEVFRAAAEAGAGMFAVIASWPSRRHHHWDLLLQARAIENLAFVAGVNRCGTDPTADYAGGTAVIDPLGVVRSRAGNAEIVLKVAIDPLEAANWRDRFPAERDRRFFASSPPAVRHGP